MLRVVFFVSVCLVSVGAVSLHDQILSDSEEALQSVIQGANLGRVGDRQSMTALHLAAYKGNLPLVTEILKRSKEFLNKFIIDYSGEKAIKRTPLLYAIHGLHEFNHLPSSTNAGEKAQNYFAVIRLLIEHGAKPYQRDEKGRNSLQLVLQFGLTPLIATTASEKSCTVASIGSTTDLSQQIFKNWNVFHYATYTRYRWKMISNLMLKEGAENFSGLKSYFEFVWSPLYQNLEQSNIGEYYVKRTDTWDVVAQHSREIIAQVISYCGAYISDYSSNLLAFNGQQMTPYHMAADTGDAAMLEFLITEFPQVWEEANGIEVPLSTLMHVSSLRGHKDCVDVLTKYSKTCDYDLYNRVPSQVWHLKEPVPSSLVSWEQEHCIDLVRGDNQKAQASHQDAGSHCTIDVVDGANLTPQEFEEKFLSLRKPVLVRGAVSLWPSLRKWSTDYFVRNFGILNVWMGEIPYAPQFNLPGKQGPLAHYGRYVSMVENNQVPIQMKDKPIMYVFDNEILTSEGGKGLMNDISIPNLVSEFPWSIAQFMWGPPGSGAPLHHHQDAWNGLVFGEKKWWFYPPSEMISSTKISSDWNSPYYCTQSPGDFVYVPDSWSHAIYNSKFTSAVAIEFSYPNLAK